METGESNPILNKFVFAKKNYYLTFKGMFPKRLVGFAKIKKQSKEEDLSFKITYKLRQFLLRLTKKSCTETSKFHQKQYFFQNIATGKRKAGF